MQKAEVVLSVLRERGRQGLPLTQLYRQMFNKDLYLLAYGNIYSNEGAMTPGTGGETADGMSEEKIEEIAELMRQERYRFSPARTGNRVGPAGAVLTEEQWTARSGDWLPNDDDMKFISSLMKPCRERGKYATWIAPPRVGINNQPGDFEYVKIY